MGECVLKILPTDRHKKNPTNKKKSTKQPFSYSSIYYMRIVNICLCVMVFISRLSLGVSGAWLVYTICKLFCWCRYINILKTKYIRLTQAMRRSGSANFTPFATSTSVNFTPFGYSGSVNFTPSTKTSPPSFNFTPLWKLKPPLSPMVHISFY